MVGNKGNQNFLNINVCYILSESTKNKRFDKTNEVALLIFFYHFVTDYRSRIGCLNLTSLLALFLFLLCKRASRRSQPTLQRQL
jgi:hypothetical protein